MTEKIPLLIVDEHSAVCQALTVRLRSSSRVEVVGTTHHITPTTLNTLVCLPEVALLGLTRRDSREPERIVAIVQQLVQLGVAVIILTSYADDTERERLLRAGARRYLLKDINTPQLIAEIESVANEVSRGQPRDIFAVTSVRLEQLH